MTTKSMFHRFVAGAMAFAVTACASLSTFAAETNETVPDLDATNSISITLKDSNKNAVEGGEFELVEVAKVTLTDADLSYEFVNGFENCGVTLGDLSDSTLASQLEAKLASSAETSKQTTDANGTLKFDNLECGLYLVINTAAATGYEKVSSFIVSAPSKEDGKWVYDVDATPKMEVTTGNSPTPTPTPTPTAPPSIPQTGQTNWPIPVLIIGGLLLFTFGVLLKRGSRKDEV